MAAPIGLSPLRRTAIIVDAPSAFDSSAWPLVLEAEEEFYFKPKTGRLLFSPCDETSSPPVDAGPDEYDVAVAVDRLESATNLLVERIRRSWAGLRTFTPDRQFAIGFDGAQQGFFWCVGQNGCGMQTAPAVGDLCAQLIVDGRPSTMLKAFGINESQLAPARFTNL